VLLKVVEEHVEDSPFTLQDNLKMFFNLMNNKDRFDRFINFASGADFDKN
jgi:hypothetical protein